MSLRPRYSLLTLLVLTALVAGAVKLWYGPHHVLERPMPGVEDEYIFTLDWVGNRIIHGPRVLRDKNGIIESVEISFYRQGEKLPWVYAFLELPVNLRLNEPLIAGLPQDCPLNERERVAFDNAIAQAKQQTLKPGKRRSEYLGSSFFRPSVDTRIQ